MLSQKYKQTKDENNDAQYEVYSVTYEVPSYFNKFECGKNILNILDVTYERACMSTQKEEYYRNMLETIIEHNNRHNVPFSKKKLRQSFSTIMVKIKEKERDAKRNTNNVTTDTFIQSPYMSNTTRNKSQVPNEKIISSDSLAEMIK